MVPGELTDELTIRVLEKIELAVRRTSANTVTSFGLRSAFEQFADNITKIIKDTRNERS